ncbi:MAG: hydroxymethylglutaryl-CoA lyase [Thermaerobacter sp.]|nr:hydroxymethylglutaryl-CoA lyase [Thermaerobacter sp.]
MRLPDRVVLRDVSPRDGLQSEPVMVSTEHKLELIDGLAHAGVSRIEAVSVVHPKLVPQLADAEAVMANLTRRAYCRYAVLVPNIKGAQRAVTMNPDEITVFLSASETHNWKNVHRSITDSLQELQTVCDMSRAHHVPPSAVIVASFGCPYEGEVPTSVVVDLAYRLFGMGVREITLGDTVGVANPKKVQAIFSQLRQDIPGLNLGGHFHDNRGTALVNMLAAIDVGITLFDTALGGIGGSPFSPGAGGNLATEDAVYMLEESGVATGINLDALLALGDRLEVWVGHPLPSRVRRARGRMVPVGPEGYVQ